LSALVILATILIFKKKRKPKAIKR